MNLVCFSFLFFFVSLTTFAQQPWNGKKCAVVLTYDDALNVHLNNAIPVLDSVGFKVTFYISGSFPGFTQRLQDWRKAAQHGHELGNHTLFHPCDASLPGRQWVSSENDLSKYTLKRITEEIQVTNVLLEAIDGKKSRTFAYTCGDAKVGTQFFMDGLKGELMAARGVRGEMHPVDQIDLYYTDGYIINNDSGEKMTSLVKKAMKTNTLLIFVFHGVGGEHSLDVSLAAHSELVHFLKQQEKDIWVAPLVDVADFLKQQKR